MTKYTTGNPVGSADPRDLYDTATVADKLVQGTDAAYPDRLGVSRRSWKSIENEAAEFFESSGYEFVGDYAAGIEITRYSQVVRDTAGEFWRASGSTTLPYTTTVAGLPEGGAFVAVGDAVLRQGLAASTTGNGSDLIAHTGTTDTVTEALDKNAAAISQRTIYVGSVAELEALDVPVGTNVYLTEDGRAGEFVVKAGMPPADPQKGIYIVLANGNYAGRIFKGAVNPRWFGASGDGTAPDRAALVGADAFGPIRLSRGSYRIESALTINSDIEFDDYASLAPDLGVTVTVNGLCTGSRAGNVRAGAGTVTLSDITISVPSDHSTIQSAVDSLPKSILQIISISIASGTYDESVVVDGICVAANIPETGASRPRLVISGANGVSKDPNVRIKSITATGCLGSNTHPGISRLTVYGEEPYGSNAAAVSFNGCTSAEVGNVSFDGDGCQNCIIAYSSRVMYNNCDFGNSVNTNAVRTKHLGTVQNQGNNTGSLLGHVYFPETGVIHADSFGTDTTVGALGIVATARFNNQIAGVLLNSRDQSISGVRKFNAGLLYSEWHSRFESIDNYILEQSGGNVTLRDTEGLRLQTGATNGNFAGIKVRRRAQLFTSDGLFFSQGQTVEIAKYFVVKGGGKWEAVSGDLDGDYFGFRFDGVDLYGISKQGANESTVLLEANWNDPIGAMSATLMNSYIEFWEKSNFMGYIDTNLPVDNATSTLFHFRLTAQEAADNILYIGEARVRK